MVKIQSFKLQLLIFRDRNAQKIFSLDLWKYIIYIGQYILHHISYIFIIMKTDIIRPLSCAIVKDFLLFLSHICSFKYEDGSTETHPARTGHKCCVIQSQGSITSIRLGVSLLNYKSMSNFNKMICNSLENVACHITHLSKQGRHVGLQFWGAQSCQPVAINQQMQAVYGMMQTVSPRSTGTQRILIPVGYSSETSWFTIFPATAFGILQERNPALGGSEGHMSECWK
jgi:hypothetical protein